MPNSHLRLTDSRTTALAARAADHLKGIRPGGHDRAAKASLSIETADGKKLDVSLPPESVALMAEVLAELGKGLEISLASVQTELTSQQAADRLGVSRPFLVRLLDSGAIPHRRVGNRRKVRLDDLLAYQEKDRAERRRILDQLTAESESQGLYD